MAVKSWEPIKVQYCDHRKHEVALEAQIVFPSEMLPDQNPRVTAHRCSMGMACNLESPSCVWSGTNPGYDPF